jgi:FKBP-type peptidyl-prolyl cis-trans isomerase
MFVKKSLIVLDTFQLKNIKTMKHLILILLLNLAFLSPSFAQSDSTATADSLKIAQDSVSMISELLAVFDKYDMNTEIDSVSYSYGIEGRVNNRMRKLDPLMYIKGMMDKYYDTIRVDKSYSRAYSQELYQRYRNRNRPKINNSVASANQKTVSDAQLEALKMQYDTSIIKGLSFFENNQKRPKIITTASGLQYEIKINGSGGRPKLEDKVEIYYVCTNIEGKEVFPVSQVKNFSIQNGIKAWQEILPIMNVGATYKVYAPYNLAFGAAGKHPVKPFETLIYTIELVRINE